MKTKHNISILALCLFAFSSIAQTTYNSRSTINKVVIYEKGAMVTRSINTENILSSGTVIIDSLPKGINPKSIQVNSSEGIKIISVKYDTKLEKSEFPKEYDSIQNVIRILNDSIQYQNTIASSLNHEIGVIESNKNFQTDQGVNVEQISQATELYKSKLRNLKYEQLSIKLKIRELNNKIGTLNNELSKLKVKTFVNQRAIVKIENPTDSPNELSLSYFTPNATWYSFYDLRVNSKTLQNVLDHKAYVSQATGEDWESAQLTLSNRNPQKRINPPVLKPYKLQNIKHKSNGQSLTNNGNIITGVVTDPYGDPLIGANITVQGTYIGTVTNIDGSFRINTYNNSKILISYIGYESKEIDLTNYSRRSQLNITLNEGQLLDEVVATASRASVTMSKTGGYKKTKKQTSKRKSISIKEQQSLNISSFEILRPYSIPSNGEEYDVLLKSNEIPFEFNYTIYPSIEPIAYLNVGIPNWKDYNLFSGKVNLFLDGQYTGVSNINISEKRDTLWFSLGADIGVNVERNPVKDYNKKSFFKNKTIELHTFDIEIKNNKNKTINIIVKDQVPISTDEEIKVKILEISNAKYEKNSGFLEWKSNLNASKKLKYRISYEIKYSKNIKVINP